MRGALLLWPAADADHRPGGGITVEPGGTADVATATIVENPGIEVALAIHVRSTSDVGSRGVVRDQPGSRFPTSVVSQLTHPAGGARPGVVAGGTTVVAAGGMS